MRRNGFFLGINRPKWQQIKRLCTRQSRLINHFGRVSLSLAGCSPAEPASVSTQQHKILNQKLYLQPVKKSSHVQYVLESHRRICPQLKTDLIRLVLF